MAHKTKTALKPQTQKQKLNMERESVAGFNREEADDFLERIDEVSKQVHDIIEGNVDVD